MSKSAITQARDLIERWEDGDVDNAAEGLQEAHGLLAELPKSEKALRIELEEIQEACAEILREVYG